MGGIMFNEDNCHFIYTRYHSMCETGLNIGIKELHAFIDQYKDTQVKEFAICVNAMLAFFPSASRENAIDKYRENAANHIVHQVDPSTDDFSGNEAKCLFDLFVNQGLDLYQIWIDRLRENRISPWISIRMNDIHFADNDGQFLVSQFYRDHKHLRRAAHRPYSKYYDYALDYSYPEVREHYLALIREVAERYDFDGMELDWMREPFTLGVGKEREGIEILTDFIREVRSILDLAEKARGHAIKISVRVPYSPEVALRMGFDVINWARSGLVDVVIPTARWITTDNDMPIDFWKQVLHGTNVMLCAGLELLVGPSQLVEWSAGSMHYNSLETARGSAVAYLSMGADRIYLYNHMDYLESPIPMQVTTIEGSVIDPERYHSLLTTIGELDTAADLPRRHVTTYHDITAPGMRSGYVLPFICNPPDERNKYDFHDLRVATGVIPGHAEKTLVIGIDCEDELNASDIAVYVNGKSCTLYGVDVVSARPRPSCRMYSFGIAANHKFPDASIVEIATHAKRFTVEWVEISVNCP